MNISSFRSLIDLDPKEILDSPIMLISNSACIDLANSFPSVALDVPNMISSTSIWKIKISFLKVLQKRAVSTCPLVKPLSRRKALNISYQALGACFRPYNDFSNLKTCSGDLESSKQGG